LDESFIEVFESTLYITMHICKSSYFLLKKKLRFSLLPVVFGLLILLPAGTLNFWQVYVYITILVIPMPVVLFYFLKNDPQFLERRTMAKEKERTQIIIVSGLDRRFGWSSILFYIVL
jgi:hypothetical protein